MNLFQALIDALDRAERSFDPDELAFLALTSKIEFPFRDRFAYALTTAAAKTGGRIAREYKRADIAWLQGSAVRCIIELKACYTRGLFTKPQHHVDRMKADLLKAQSCGGPGCSCFAVLLATHPLGTVKPELRDTIKYSGIIEQGIKLGNGNPAELRKLAVQEIEPRLRRLGPIHPFCWKLGSYLGISVELLGWLVQVE